MPENQTHPVPVNEETRLHINAETNITVQVMGYELNSVDGAYHYHLQAVIGDGNNMATVQFGDVHQSLLYLY